MGEGFDDAQALDHLLNVAVHLAQGLLLPLVELAAAPADYADGKEAGRQHEERDEEERRAGEEHDGDYAHKEQRRGKDGDDALLQHLLHIVRVVGEAAHELAVGVLVVEVEGQVLHLVEELGAQLVGAPMGKLGHYGRLRVGAYGAEQEDAGHDGEHLRQVDELIRERAAAHQLVEHGPDEVGAGDTCHRAYDDAEENDDEQPFLAANILHEPEHGALCVLGLLIAAARAGAAGAVTALPAFVFSHCLSLLPAGTGRSRGKCRTWP